MQIAQFKKLKLFKKLWSNPKYNTLKQIQNKII